MNEWSNIGSLARSSWNATPTTIYYNSESYGSGNNARLVFGGVCTAQFGLNLCSGAQGVAWGIDTSYANCSLGTSCAVLKWVTKLDTGQFLDSCYDLSDPADEVSCLFEKQAITAHELGHTVSLGHQPTISSGFDGNCGSATEYQSVMDYDCIANAIINGPTAWDSCGVNHAYYDPGAGWGGCTTP